MPFSPCVRVGLVSSFMPPHLGGLETVAEANFRAYRGAGCEVRWIASRVVPGAPAEDGRIRVACWNGLERSLGVPWPVWGVEGAREVTRLVRWADVLHVHDCLYLSSALTVLLARRARKPVVLSQHIGFVRYPSKALNAIEHIAYRTLGRAVLKAASHLVLCTPPAEAIVAKLLDGLPTRSSDIPYGVDTRRFHPPSAEERSLARGRLGLPAADRVALFAGRLVEKKGSALFVTLSERMPDWQFLMVGDGPQRPAARPNLTWIRHVPQDDMAGVYQAADVFVLPSHSEGFPLSVLEAMASGLPVVTSKGEPFAERLEREGACVAAAHSPVAFEEALRRLWATPGLVEGTAAQARALVVREWSLEHMDKRYVELVVRLAGGR